MHGAAHGLSAPTHGLALRSDTNLGHLVGSLPIVQSLSLPNPNAPGQLRSNDKRGDVRCTPVVVFLHGFFPRSYRYRL